MPPLNPLTKSCIALAVSQLLLVPSMSHAATITVNSNADNNGAGCTLREAIVSANTSTSQGNGCAIGSNNGTDTITFSNSLVSNKITLSNGELSVGAGKDIEINASAISGGITVDANQGSRVIGITSAVVTLSNMTLTGGLERDISDETNNYYDIGLGGAIYAINSNLTLNTTMVTGNSAQVGTGIGVVESELNLNNSSVDNNTVLDEGEQAFFGVGTGATAGAIASQNSNSNLNSSSVSNNTGGGGIFVGDGSLTITNSTISDNSALGYAGGILFVAEQNLTINSSTISGNSAPSGFAGAIIFIASDSSLILNNSTLSGNSSADVGGIFFSGTQLTINNSTLSDNSASGDLTVVGIPAVGGIASLRADGVSLNNSIIANSAGYDCFNLEQLYQPDFMATTIVDGATIIEDGSCGANRSGDPGLLPLADNNGPTQTHALSTGSIARNSSIGDCLLTDQRGQTRDISDGFCDVGAVEFDPSLVNEPTTFVIPLPNGKSVIFDL